MRGVSDEQVGAGSVGRRKTTDGNATHLFSLRPTAEELVALKANAEAAGTSLNRYLIERGLAQGGSSDPIVRELWERAAYEVRKSTYQMKRLVARLKTLEGGEIDRKIGGTVAETLAALEAIAEALEKSR